MGWVEREQNRPWALGTLIYEAVKSETEENWFEPVLNTHTPLSTLSLLFICSLLNPVAKQVILGGKKIAESSGGLLQSSNGP